MDNLFSSRSSQNTKLRDRLNIEKPNLSDADLSSEVTKNVDNTLPASSGNRQKQQVETKAIENEDVVKYMSNLPSYLEKGENLNEKALNVGVLDWRSLEKWQCNHKPMSCQSSKYSPSSSNTSSFFSTDGSSTQSSGGHSRSPAHQRMHLQTIQFNPTVSQIEGYYQSGKTIGENVGKFQDFKAASSNPLKVQQSIFRMYQSFSKTQSEIKLKECERKDSVSLNIRKTGTSPDLKNCGLALQAKGRTKIQDGDSTSGLERHKTVAVPRDDPESSNDAISCPCDLAAVNGRRTTEASRRSFSDGSLPKEAYNSDSHSDIPHSCPLPCEDDNSSHLEIKPPSSADAKNIKFSSEPLEPPPFSLKMSIGPSRGKNLEEKSSKVVPSNSAVTKSSDGSDLQKGRVSASKLRNLSPTRRFIIGLGRIGQTSCSKDGSTVPQLSSEDVTTKSGSDKAVASSCLESSRNDKPNSKSRSQFSPLRRLLDPLLKPKAVNSHQSAEPSEKDLTSTVRACKSSKGQVDSSTAQSVKVKLDLTSCKTVNVDDSHHSNKHRSSTVQALLQVAIKNGLPLFTFADDNNSDILAATMRKDDHCWIYTFFHVHEVKKKGGWTNRGNKGKSRGYLPNVVAQMTVSDAQLSNLVRHNSVDQLSIREFVLFAVDLKRVDQKTPDLQPNDELAAIIVKFPKEPRSLNKDEQQSDYSTDPSVIGLQESLHEVRGYPTSRENEENGSCIPNHDLLSTTVILPSGVHGLPRKGEPSPLIDRWKSGGLCDCGGWDLGCRMRVLANRTKLRRRSSSSKAHRAVGGFELFSQGELLEDKPVFSLSPFKDSIFSVEFNSSLSFLQAFSICIAVLNSRKPFELSEFSKLFEEKSSEEITLAVNDEIKPPSPIQAEVPASSASYPPLSPVGRV